MTRGLEEMLNLPSLDDLLKEEAKEKNALPVDEASEVEVQVAPEFGEDTNAIDREGIISKLDQAQQTVDFVEGKDHGESMDLIFEETLKHSRDLMDYGYNIDHARARGIFEVATTMYKVALDAKNSKRDAQLKAMKLKLDQQRLEIDRIRLQGEDAQPATINTHAVIVEDRNELIKRLREQALQESAQAQAAQAKETLTPEAVEQDQDDQGDE
jgi:hypothetical protein